MRQTRGVYLISVAARTLEMHPQTLRKYERAGFIEPLRMGTLRAYSDEDIARLRLIKHFVDDLGLNLSGVELALQLTNELLELRMQLTSDEQSPRRYGRVHQEGGRNAGNHRRAGSPQVQEQRRRTATSPARRGLVQG